MYDEFAGRDRCRDALQVFHRRDAVGNAAAARVRLIVWCKAGGHQVEPDAVEMAERYGANTAVPEWRERLVCSKCGSREVVMVMTGTPAAVARSKARTLSVRAAVHAAGVRNGR